MKKILTIKRIAVFLSLSFSDTISVALKDDVVVVSVAFLKLSKKEQAFFVFYAIEYRKIKCSSVLNRLEERKCKALAKRRALQYK